jgi:hypothetical protein
MIDYAACMNKAFPGVPFTLSEDENGLVLTTTAPTSILALQAFWIPVCKEKALLEIKDIRKQGLDKAALSPGILAIYNTNYEAAVEFLADRPATVMKNGMTAEAYLTGFGAKLQMTAVQFANYIIAENLRVGPTVYDVEKRYLALAYAGGDGITPIAYLSTEAAIEAAISNFRTFCGV